MNRFFTKNRFFVSYRVHLDNNKYPNASTMLQQDAIIGKVAASHGAILIKDFLDIDEFSSVRILCEAIIYTKEKNGVLTLSCSDSIINSYEHIKEIVNAQIDFLFCDKPHITSELLVKILKDLEVQIRIDLENRKNNLPVHLKKRYDHYKNLKKQLQECELHGKHKDIPCIKVEISSLSIGNRNYYSQAGRLKGGYSRRIKAQQDEANIKAFELVNRMMLEAAPLNTIAYTLNMAGYRTSRGCKYFASSVRNLANLYRPMPLNKAAAVTKDEVNERLYNKLLNDEEAHKDLYSSV